MMVVFTPTPTTPRYTTTKVDVCLQAFFLISLRDVLHISFTVARCKHSFILSQGVKLLLACSVGQSMRS